MPVSLTCIYAWPPSVPVEITTRPPGRLYFTALSARLYSISSKMYGTPVTNAELPCTEMTILFCCAGIFRRQATSCAMA